MLSSIAKCKIGKIARVTEVDFWPYLEWMPELRLAFILKKKKMSKRQFAKLLDMDYPTVFRYFRPGYDPKLSTLAKWAQVLDVKIRVLFRE